jgi:hypothetical protein
MCYGPDFELDVIPGNRSDLNTAEDMKRLAETICRKYYYTSICQAGSCDINTLALVVRDVHSEN